MFLLGCIKEDYPPECVPRNLTELQKSNFGGKWRWFETDIEQWFDFGPSNYLDYTPQSQGFEYYFIINDEGMFRGYRNDSLVHEFVFNRSTSHTNSNEILYRITFKYDCIDFDINFTKLLSSLNLDTITTQSFPINFNDEENHLISKRNYFVRE
jgi:hypothetical protein